MADFRAAYAVFACIRNGESGSLKRVSLCEMERSLSGFHPTKAVFEALILHIVEMEGLRAYKFRAWKLAS